MQPSLYQIIKSLQSAQGSLAKQAILMENKDNELLKAYMKATYDVGLNYYQKKIPKTTVVGTRPFDSIDITSMRSQLAERMFTGKAAIKALQGNYEAMNEEGQELLALMIDRSIGANVGNTMVLNTWPDLYFIPPYMRCSSMDEKILAHYAAQEYFFVQTKRDGSFAYLKTNKDDTAAYTRQGGTYPAWFAKHMAQGFPMNAVLVGEMEVYQWNGDSFSLMARKDGNGVLNSILQGEDEKEFESYQFKYVAWDSLTEDEFKAGRSESPYEIRLGVLMTYLTTYNPPNVELCFTERVTSIEQAKKIQIDHTKRGLEGTVWKTADGIWRDSSSGTKDAVKNKVVFEADYEIYDSYEGTGKAKGMLGGIRIKTRCDNLKNDCGSGFSDDDRKRLWAMRLELPGMIVAVEANDITTSRTKTTVSLSLPIFKELRAKEDKKVADDLVRVYAQFEAAKMGQTLTN